MERAEILEELRIIIVETAGVDDDQIVEEATLFGDLMNDPDEGAVQFLEVCFRTEESFGNPFPSGVMGEILEALEPYFVGDRRAVLARCLCDSYGVEVDIDSLSGLEPFDQNALRDTLEELFTVKVMVDFFERHAAA